MAQTRKKRRPSVLKAVLIALAVYTVLLTAAGWLYDARHAEIVMNGPEHVTVEYGQEYTDEGAAAYTVGRLFGVREIELETEGNYDITELGSYEILYFCGFRGETVKSVRTVTVQDTVPPEITLISDQRFNATLSDGFQEAGFSAADNHDGIITDRVSVEIREDKVVYTVTDSSGNTATAEREIHYAPSEATLLLYGDSDITVPASLSYADPGYTAYDGMGNDVSAQVLVTYHKDGETGTTEQKEKEIAEFTPYLPGTYVFTYTMRCEGDTEKKAERTVTVAAAEIPKSESPARKTVYLTFDDGPGQYTEELLDILKYYGVKATFFVTNQFPDYTDLLSREAAEGHTVAIHTYCHDYKTIYSGVEEYVADFMQIRELIYEKTGVYTNMFRFPGGSSNMVSAFNKGIMTTLSKAMPALGFKAFDWNCSSGDAGSNKVASDTIFEYATTGPEGIEQAINTFGYAVLLQHDTKDFSIEAVGKIIEWGLAKGYTFAAMDMTSPRAWHAVNN